VVDCRLASTASRSRFFYTSTNSLLGSIPLVRLWRKPTSFRLSCSLAVSREKFPSLDQGCMRTVSSFNWFDLLCWKYKACSPSFSSLFFLLLSLLVKSLNECWKTIHSSEQLSGYPILENWKRKFPSWQRNVPFLHLLSLSTSCVFRNPNLIAV